MLSPGSRWPQAAAGESGATKTRESEFFKFISVDFSSLETRFCEIIARIEGIEARLDRSTPAFSGTSAQRGDGKRSNVRRALEEEALAAMSTEATLSGATAATSDHSSGIGNGTDPINVAEEIEALRAAHLRLKIDQEITLAA